MPAGLLLAPFLCLPTVARGQTVDAEAALSPQSAKSQTHIGLAITHTGTKEALSTALRSAVTAVIEHLNSLPGTTHRLSLRIEEDQCTERGGADAAHRLLAAGVTFVLGHPCSNAASAAAKVYASANIPFLAVGTRHPELTKRRPGPLVFRLGGRDDLQAAETIRMLQPELLGKRVAIIHDRTRYARRLSEGLTAGLRSVAAEVTVHPIVAGERGYDGLLSALQARKPDVIYFAVFPAEGIMIAKSILNAALITSFIFSDMISVDVARAAIQGTQAHAVAIESTAQSDGDDLAAHAATLIGWIYSERAFDNPQAIAMLIGADQWGEIETPSYRAISLLSR